MPYARGVVERAMTIQEVILRAIAGQLTWLQAADILGRSPRSIRRLRWKLEHEGYEGLFDRRQQTPSPKRAPVAEVQRVLALYRDRYQGFNVRHFHQLARRALLRRLRQEGAADGGPGPPAAAARPAPPAPRAAPVFRRTAPPRRQSASLAGLGAGPLVHAARRRRRRHQARALRPTPRWRRKRAA